MIGINMNELDYIKRDLVSIHKQLRLAWEIIDGNDPFLISSRVREERGIETIKLQNKLIAGLIDYIERVNK